MRKTFIIATSLCLLLLGVPSIGYADEYEAGSLIIPMDTDYQDMGMFKAFGLLFQLLDAGVPVQWSILPDKEHGDLDFTASATDFQTDEVITDHGYRAGPFLIRAEDRAEADPIIEAWHVDNITTVHVASEPFDAPIYEYLVAAPTIAMFADGNEDIAREYVLAAGIPDSAGDLTWPDDSPDMLTIEEISGPTDIDHADGALFDEDGFPVYCQLMSMHWKIDAAEDNPEVVAEVRSFLRYPVHFFAECQAVNAFENNVNGRFLTEFGFDIDNIGNGDPVDLYNHDSPFAQHDGTYELVGGSERSYTVCGDEECTIPGDYRAGGVVMITAEGTPEAVQDVWMTGYVDGGCPPDAKLCEFDGDIIGKVSYLGGHEYSTDLPISENPDSVGTRLFLQSLFEAPCVTESGQPTIALVKSGPAATDDGSVTFELAYSNDGPGFALDATISDPIPAGATFVSASNDGMNVDGTVIWELGNLIPGESGTVTVTVQIDTFGESVTNTGSLEYRTGVSIRSVESNPVTTIYDDDRDGDGIADGDDPCPDDPGLTDDLQTDSQNCGSCGNDCGTDDCVAGLCMAPGDDDADAGMDAGDAGDAGDDDAGDAGDAGDNDTDDAMNSDIGDADASEADTGDDDTATTDDTGSGDDGTADATGGGDGTGGDDGADDGSGRGTDSGCGCSTAPTSQPWTTLAAFALVVGIGGRRRWADARSRPRGS